MNNRLPWTRRESGTGFVAYPDITCPEARAQVQFNATLPIGRQWQWSVQWPDRFRQNGQASDKQAAADEATAAWHKLAATTAAPRNVRADIEALLEAIESAPPPAALWEEDSDYLRKVLWHIKERWGEEIRHERTPAPVSELMTRISEILYRRRTNGQGDREGCTRRPASGCRLRRSGTRCLA
jgi:hypothetical protein